jgi:hypothetical protein
MIERLIITSSKYEKIPDFPGKSGVAQATGIGGNTRQIEFFGLPGVEVCPPKGVHLLYLPVSGSQSFGVAVGGHNYKIAPEVAQGGVRIYSTDASGESVKASVLLTPEGKITIVTDSAIEVEAGGDVTLQASGTVAVDAEEIQLNGDGESLVKFGPLKDALDSLITSLNAEFAKKMDLAGAPGGLSLDIGDAEAESVLTD